MEAIQVVISAIQSVLLRAPSACLAVAVGSAMLPSCGGLGGTAAFRRLGTASLVFVAPVPPKGLFLVAFLYLKYNILLPIQRIQQRFLTKYFTSSSLLLNRIRFRTATHNQVLILKMVLDIRLGKLIKPQFARFKFW